MSYRKRFHLTIYKQMQFDGENKLLKKIKSMNAVDHTKQCHLMSNCTILMTVY